MATRDFVYSRFPNKMAGRLNDFWNKKLNSNYRSPRSRLTLFSMGVHMLSPTGLLPKIRKLKNDLIFPNPGHFGLFCVVVPNWRFTMGLCDLVRKKKICTTLSIIQLSNTSKISIKICFYLSYNQIKFCCVEYRRTIYLKLYMESDDFCSISFANFVSKDLGLLHV